MAGKKKSKKKSEKKSRQEDEVETEKDDSQDVGERLTLDALDAISSPDDDDDEEEGNVEWNAEAQALRQAIADGAFDHLMKKTKEKDESEIQEVSLQDDSSSQEESNEQEQDNNEDEENPAGGNTNNNKALVAVVEQLEVAKKNMPWAETFDVVSSQENALPFDLKRGGNPLDVHDDLKREVAFYNVALDAVHVARKKCADAQIPFSRPDNFFAEMVKTDDHMAKIKDRLIFETKKMDAFAQRKANQEHKLHAKEAQAYKLEQKAKRKRQHFDALNKWQSNQSYLLNQDDDVSSTRNKKRMAADKKYGYGGKRGRFKQNSAKDLNDMSSFRPRGSGGGAKKRAGKRARDAARAKR